MGYFMLQESEATKLNTELNKLEQTFIDKRPERLGFFVSKKKKEDAKDGVPSDELNQLRKLQNEFTQNRNLEQFIEKITQLKIENKTHKHFASLCDEYIQTSISYLTPEQRATLKNSLTAFRDSYEYENRIGYSNIRDKPKNYVSIDFPEGDPSKDRYLVAQELLKQID